MVKDGVGILVVEERIRWLRPIRVLIVEDSENDALLIADQLRDNGYDPTCLRVETLDAMSEALRERMRGTL